MSRRRASTKASFNVLVATDGSPSARAALATARSFPWPPACRLRGVVVGSLDWIGSRSPEVRRLFDQTFRRLADSARRNLAQRWPDVDVITRHGRPGDIILAEARRHRTDVIVVGWRGHGAVRRFLMGSVSRDIVRRARGAVLVVRRPAREVRRVVLGVDGSPNARRAVEMVARLAAQGMVVTVVRAVEPMSVPTAGRLPASLRSVVQRELAAVNRRLVEQARQDVDRAVARIRRAGWRARGVVRTGAPLVSLLDVVAGTRAHLLVVGARSTRGLERTMLGSVATGALNRSPVPVLVVH